METCGFKYMKKKNCEKNCLNDTVLFKALLHQLVRSGKNLTRTAAGAYLEVTVSF